MKHLYKFILFSFIGMSSSIVMLAQDNTHYNWQLGFGFGYTNYYGDVSPYRIKGGNELYKIYKFADYNSYYQHQPSFSVLLQKKITPTLGIMFQANYLQFSMSDRYRKHNGTIDTTTPNFARSLNFRTTMQDAGLAFTFSPNNGRIGSENAFFYPSFYLGVGVSKFVVKGDLYDDKNAPYNYLLPGNITDNLYETNLRDLRTETDNKFRDVEPYVDLGLALNFRISESLGIALQSDIKYSASDYLDDVSATYKASYPTAAEAYAAKPGYNTVDPVTRQRGDNNGVNDFYINNRIVLNFTLGKKKTAKTFNPPVIYSLGTPYFQRKAADSIKKNIVLNADSIARVKSDSVYRAFKDSLAKVTASISQSSDSTVRKQLENINTELTGIKEILRDQQLMPRLQQLQYQTDSIKNLRSRLLQRPLTREGNLLLRVYDLQIDSLRNEYEKAKQRQNLPLGKADSSILFYQPGTMPIRGYKPVTDTIDTDIAYAYDSARSRDLYLKKIDSIQQRLDELASKSSDAGRQRSENTADSLNYIKNKLETDDQLRKQEEAVAVLQQQLKSSNDSAAYYKKLKENPRMYAAPDTVRKKESFFQRYLGIGGKKKEALVKTDTVKGGDYTSQQEYYQTQASLTNKQIDQIEKDKIDLVEKRINYAHENNVVIDSSEFTRNLNVVQKRIQQNADSLAFLQRQLQRSNDSGAYYRKLLTDAGNNANEANRKWYQNLFTSEKKKQRRIETESNIRENTIQQQQYYDNDAKNMQDRINDLERRNRDLQNSYQNYNSDGYVKRGVGFSASPVVVYDGNSNNDRNEIANLRAQIQNLQNEVNYDARGRVLGDTAAAVRNQQVTLMIPPAAAASADTSQVSTLRSELNQLRAQIDSMKVKPAPVVSEKVTKPEPRYDVTGFPVISVYFKTGSVALTSDQLNKITPFGTVAVKNKEATIVLKGFTDPVGNPAKNKIIANKRSVYIKDFLISKYKISDGRIIIEEPEGSESGATKKANPLDRRVDLQFQQ